MEVLARVEQLILPIARNRGWPCQSGEDARQIIIEKDQVLLICVGGELQLTIVPDREGIDLLWRRDRRQTIDRECEETVRVTDLASFEHRGFRGQHGGIRLLRRSSRQEQRAIGGHELDR